MIQSVKSLQKMVPAFVLIAFFLMIPSFVFANTSGYAWGENIGWIDFGQVVVYDNELSGYAYSSNIGWISFSCENTSSCGDFDYGVLNSNGNLSGYAWGENVGWIDFSNANIDPETGVFGGYAYSSNIGWLSLNVQDGNLITNWRNENIDHSSGGSGSSRVIGSINPALVVTETNTSSCNNNFIITDNLTHGARDGQYHQYNQKIVTQVSRLQSLINRLLLGKYNQAAGPIDGIFGQLTKQGVQRLQLHLNDVLKINIPLIPDGIVGPLTKAAINSVCESMSIN